MTSDVVETWEWDFFVSCTGADAEAAAWVTQVLTEAGYRVLCQHVDFVPGVDFAAKMEDGIQRAERTIALLSPEYVTSSTFGPREWLAASVADPGGRRRKLVPVRVRQTTVAGTLDQYVRIDLVGLAGPAAAERLLAGLAAARDGQWPTGVAEDGPLPGSWRGAVTYAPPVLPARYVEPTALITRLRDLVQPGRVTAVVGMAGAGKTTVARALAVDPMIAERFPDGVRWMDVGRGEGPDRAQARLAEILGSALQSGEPDDARDELRTLAAASRRLVVLDDVWDSAVLHALDVAIAPAAVLVTSRMRDVVGPSVAAVVLVELVDAETGREILAAHAGLTGPPDLPEAAEEVLTHCGGLSLALAVAGGVIAQGGSWDRVIERLSDAEDDALTKAMRSGIDALEPGRRGRYLDLAVFDGRGPVPVEVIGLLWDVALPDAYRLLDELAARSLVTQQKDGTVTVHDLQFEAIDRAAGPDRTRERHRSLADALLRHVEALDAADIDSCLVYGCANLIDHLLRGDQGARLPELLAIETGGARPTNRWFQAHVAADGAPGFLRDVHRIRAWARAEPGRAGVEVACDLVEGSLNAAASNLPSQVARELMKRGRWTWRQGLAAVTGHPDVDERAMQLARLVEWAPPADQRAIAAQAAAYVDRESAAWNAAFFVMQTVRPFLPEKAWNAHVSVFLNRERARAQSSLGGLGSDWGELRCAASLLEGSRRADVLVEVLGLLRQPGVILPNHDTQAELLAELARLRGPRHAKSLLAEARVEQRACTRPEEQVTALIAIAEASSGPRRTALLVEACWKASRVEQPRERCASFLKLVPLLPWGRRRAARAAADAAQQAIITEPGPVIRHLSAVSRVAPDRHAHW